MAGTLVASPKNAAAIEKLSKITNKKLLTADTKILGSGKGNFEKSNFRYFLGDERKRSSFLKDKSATSTGKNQYVENLSLTEDKPILSYTLKGDRYLQKEFAQSISELETGPLGRSAVEGIIQKIQKSDPYFSPSITELADVKDLNYFKYTLNVDLQGQELNSCRKFLLEIRNRTLDPQ
jgi:hypothetical protein